MFSDRELLSGLSRPLAEFANYGMCLAIWLLAIPVLLDGSPFVWAVAASALLISVHRVYVVWREVGRLEKLKTTSVRIAWLSKRLSRLNLVACFAFGLLLGLAIIFAAYGLTDLLKARRGVVPKVSIFGVEAYVTAIGAVVLLLAAFFGNKLAARLWARRQLRSERR